MTPSDQTPKLPTWIFIVTDLALLGAAGLIAWSSPRPFTDGTTLSIVLCLIIGAIAGLVPIVAHYERVKNETLDDRQRALEALSRTISSSAEQISIAATGLHAIAELSLKNLRHAEHLPQKLQEKIAEFQAALAASNDTEKEELEKELVALRSTESERLESVSDKISKAAADLTILDAASQKNLAASSEVIAHASAAALTQFSSATSAAVAQAVTTATAALTTAATSASDTITAATLAADHTLAKSHLHATSELDAKLSTISAAISTATTAALATFEAQVTASSERIERAVDAAVAAIKTVPAPVISYAPPAAPVAAPEEHTPAAAATDSPSISPIVTDGTAHPPKRPRKPRRETPASEEPTAPAPIEEMPAPIVLPPADERSPVPTTIIPEHVPVTPEATEPFTNHAVEAPAAEPAPTPANVAPEPVSEPAGPTELAPVSEPPSVAPAPPIAASASETPPAPPAPASVTPEPAPVATHSAVVAPEPATASDAPAPDASASEAPPSDAPAPDVPPSAAPAPDAPVADAPAAEQPATVADEAAPDDAPKSPRKRAAQKSAPADDDEPALGLEIDDTPAPQSAELTERVLTSDGATRLIATAYIGIGNRLFIRGEGPGLSWEKGVPLQFVSIGKWRWETPDATGPVSFKLYKNDSIECTALGKQNLDSGHQQELTASF